MQTPSGRSGLEKNRERFALWMEDGMPRGGRRAGAGRPPKGHEKRAKPIEVMRLSEDGLPEPIMPALRAKYKTMPLEYLMEVINAKQGAAVDPETGQVTTEQVKPEDKVTVAHRIEAAKSATRYMYAPIASADPARIDPKGAYRAKEIPVAKRDDTDPLDAATRTPSVRH